MSSWCDADHRYVLSAGIGAVAHARGCKVLKRGRALLVEAVLGPTPQGSCVWSPDKARPGTARSVAAPSHAARGDLFLSGSLCRCVAASRV